MHHGLVGKVKKLCVEQGCLSAHPFARRRNMAVGLLKNEEGKKLISCASQLWENKYRNKGVNAQMCFKSWGCFYALSCLYLIMHKSSDHRASDLCWRRTDQPTLLSAGSQRAFFSLLLYPQPVLSPGAVPHLLFSHYPRPSGISLVRTASLCPCAGPGNPTEPTLEHVRAQCRREIKAFRSGRMGPSNPHPSMWLPNKFAEVVPPEIRFSIAFPSVNNQLAWEIFQCLQCSDKCLFWTNRAC